MRFLGCSQCLTGIEGARSTVMSNTSCDPLLITKRPTVKHGNENSHRRISIPVESGGDTGSRRVIRVPMILRAAFNAACRKKHRKKSKNRLETRKKVKKRDVLRERSSRSISDSRSDGNFLEVKTDDQQRRRDEYCEHLEALKFILEPGDSFGNSGVTWNASGKLSSLDFRRINTIAIPHESTWNLRKFQNKFDGSLHFGKVLEGVMILLWFCTGKLWSSI